MAEILCGFNEAWIGLCKNLRPCNKHATLVCCVCKNRATHECDQTGQFVCGYPLCDDCDHTIFEDGTNGGVGFNQAPCPEGMGTHCRKSEQRFTPWYMRDE
jgi:hypothetical protein